MVGIEILERGANALRLVAGDHDQGLEPGLEGAPRGATGQRLAAQVEQALAALRQANCRVEDLELGRADLEDVFLSIMQNDATEVSA